MKGYTRVKGFLQLGKGKDLTALHRPTNRFVTAECTNRELDVTLRKVTRHLRLIG